jgi:hypothetical protein
MYGQGSKEGRQENGHEEACIQAVGAPAGEGFAAGENRRCGNGK